MEVKIKVKAGSSKNLVVKEGDSYIVYVKARAEKGKANSAVIKLLKKYFDKDVRIVKGLRNKEKTIIIF